MRQMSELTDKNHLKIYYEFKDLKEQIDIMSKQMEKSPTDRTQL